MIYYGVSLMACAGLGLAGVLAQLHYLVVVGYHDLALHDPLTQPTNWVERRHLRRPCATCGLVAELATAHVRSAPVRSTSLRKSRPA